MANQQLYMVRSTYITSDSLDVEFYLFRGLYMIQFQLSIQLKIYVHCRHTVHVACQIDFLSTNILSEYGPYKDVYFVYLFK